MFKVIKKKNIIYISLCHHKVTPFKLKIKVERHPFHPLIPTMQTRGPLMAP